MKLYKPHALDLTMAKPHALDLTMANTWVRPSS